MMNLRRFLPLLAVLGSLWSSTASFAQAPAPVPGLPDTERRTSYSLTSQTGPFSVGFALYGDSTDYGDWVQVFLCTSATLNPCSQLTAVTQWTLSSPSGSLATLARPITDATITLTSAQTGTLQIVGARRPRRTSQFAENRGVAARDLNQTVTDLVAQNREQWDLLNRTIQGQPSEVIAPLQPASSRKGGILCWDSTGLIPLTCSPGPGTGTVIGPNVSVVGHIATFGNTNGTLLTDGGLIGAGNVVGPTPSASTVNHAVTWKDSGGVNVIDSGLTLTPSTGTITVTNAKTLTIDNTLEFAGTDSTKMTFPGASDTVAALNTAETWLAAQTFTNSTIKLLGSSTGVTTLTSANSGASNFTLTIPAATDTVAELGQANAFTGNNSFSGTSLFTGSAFSLASNGQGTIGATATAGAILGGQGSTSDITLTNKSGATACSVPTGTTTLNCGTLTFGTLDPASLALSTTTISGLSTNNSPTPSADYIAYYSASDGRIRKATVAAIASAATAGVSSLNGLTGALSIATSGASNVAAVGSTVTVATPDYFFAQNCTLAASVATNILTVALKDGSGADPSTTSPCRIPFRSVTATTGSTVIDSVTSALSITTNATGATLGSSSNTAFRIWVVAFDNGGTAVLALINCSTSTQIFPLNEGVVASSTAISGSATSAGVFYTPNGTTLTSKAFKILGYVEYNSTGLVTAGTYATGPNFIQTFGPGIRKPGEVVQTAYATTTSTTTTTSSTFTSTNLAQSVTPTSAANPIRFVWNGSASTAAGGSTEVFAQLFRGATGVGVITMADVNSPVLVAGLVGSPGIDLPNSTSSTTYTAKIRNNNNSTSITFPYGAVQTGASLILDEIMG